MSLRFRGPLTRDGATDYAVSSTFLIGGNPNKQAVNCKVCGKRLEKGDGVTGYVREVLGSRSVSCYFCPEDADWVREVSARWVQRQRENQGEA